MKMHKGISILLLALNLEGGLYELGVGLDDTGPDAILLEGQLYPFDEGKRLPLVYVLYEGGVAFGFGGDCFEEVLLVVAV
jgi:hypothetical protein